MRKFLTFLMLLVLVAPQALRADEYIVGDGTLDSRDNPFQNYYSNGYTELIYPASEIGQAGMINSLAFYCTTPGASQYVHELRIYIGETDKSAYSGNRDWTPEADLTMVYQHTALTIGATDGWQTFEFDTPYLYEGLKNLVVVIAKKGQSYASGLRWQYTNVPN